MHSTPRPLIVTQGSSAAPFRGDMVAEVIGGMSRDEILMAIERGPTDA